MNTVKLLKISKNTIRYTKYAFTNMCQINCALFIKDYQVLKDFAKYNKRQIYVGFAFHS